MVCLKSLSYIIHSLRQNSSSMFCQNQNSSCCRTIIELGDGTKRVYTFWILKVKEVCYCMMEEEGGCKGLMLYWVGVEDVAFFLGSCKFAFFLNSDLAAHPHLGNESSTPVRCQHITCCLLVSATFKLTRYHTAWSVTF